MWGATSVPFSSNYRAVDFNPRSPCGERLAALQRPGTSSAISIHAPRVGSDRLERCAVDTLSISIHAPRVGSDLGNGALGATQVGISIHAHRVGSDPAIIIVPIPPPNFNPRSPCGERRITACRMGATSHFNPRSPCGERPLTSGRPATLVNFNPRSPCGERRFRQGEHKACLHDFNPRSPCGERRLLHPRSEPSGTFQSTLPVWGATYKPEFQWSEFKFQSTLPVWGATQAFLSC